MYVYNYAGFFSFVVWQTSMAVLSCFYYVVIIWEEEKNLGEREKRGGDDIYVYVYTYTYMYIYW